MENLLLAKLFSVNSPYFDFLACDFSEKNMHSKDKFSGKECTCTHLTRTVPLGGLHGPPHTADVDMDVRVHQDMSEAAGTHAGHSAFL